jgi:hypothetical protein
MPSFRVPRGIARPGAAAVAALSLLVASAGYASPTQPSAEEKAGARAAAAQGNTAFMKQDYERAIELFSRAQSLIDAPPHLLMIARSQVALGRLVAARETYMSIARSTLAADAPSAFKAAQASAKSELAELSPRIPSIDLRVSHPEARDLVVTMDDNPVPAALVGMRRPIDPGDYVFQARARGWVSAKKPVAVSEGERLSVTLDLSQVDGADDAISTGDEGTARPSQGSGAGLRIAGYSALGVGTAGLIMGGVFLGLSIGQQSDADRAYDACSAAGCMKDSAEGKEIRALDDGAASKRTASIVSFVVGGALAATGVGLVVFAPKKATETRAASLEPWIGLGSAGVRGSF